MNRKIGMISSVINICAVAGFALCMPLGFLFGDYLASIFIAFSFVLMMCAFAAHGKQETKVAGYTTMVFAGMYAVINLLVYYAQLTTIRLDKNLTAQATALLDYQTFGLFFSYDLLGYCLMALSTFFAGLIVDVKTKFDKILKCLLLIHGVFAISCFIMPMLGVFNSDMQGADWIGTAILNFWCIYFIPVGILSFAHFKRKAVSPI